jgi:amino acid adenylation domain-containing protein
MNLDRRRSALDFHVDRVRDAEAMTARFAPPQGGPETTPGLLAEHPCERPIPTELRAQLEKVSAGVAANKWLLYLLAVQSLMARYADTPEVLVATPPLRDSSSTHGDTLLFVRGHFSAGTTFRDQLSTLRADIAAAQSHRDYDYAALLQRVADLGCRPETIHDVLLHCAAVHGSAVSPTERAFRLRFVVDPRDATLTLWYRRDGISPELADRLIDLLLSVLAHIVSQPASGLADLSLLTDEDRLAWRRWNGIAQPSASADSIVAAFSAQVARTPNRVALCCEGESLTYAELDAHANRLAHRLRGLGIGPESVVAICLERSIAMGVAILGTLKAGGIYLPLDPSYPQDRLHFMLTDAQARVALCSQALRARLAGVDLKVIELDASDEQAHQAAQPAGPPHVPLNAGHAAYIIYTSGSTGQPKGVVVQHGNVLSLLAAGDLHFQFGSDDVWTLFHSFAFDFSVWELFGALLSGGRLVIVPYLVSRSTGDFYRLLHDQGVTVLNQTPSAFRQLVAWEQSQEALPLRLRYVIFGGEALEPAQLAPWVARHGDESPQLINMYGITETTVHVTFYRLRRAETQRPGRSIIGRPLPGWSIYLLDRLGKLVPPGLPGEICVGGCGLARGYLNRPQLNAERFIWSSDASEAGQPAQRLYKSGDRGRLLPSGDLEYLGRIDHQLKIRGFRIEAGEIEAALGRHPAVRRACVVARGQEDPQLVAYVEKGSDTADHSADSDGVRVSQVSQWREIYDELYADRSARVDPVFNIVGWNDSFTRQPIPAAQMRAWVDSTVARVLDLRPRRVLEIGCGTGLLLFRIAPHVERYVATDFSQAAVDFVSTQITSQGSALSHVAVRQGAAHEIDAQIADERFDAVIINSVVQYFPDQDYLRRVLTAVCAKVVSGGFVFVGDVRDHTTLPAFHLALSLAGSDEAAANVTLAAELERRLADEEELTVDPAFFLALPRDLPQVQDVRPLVKRGGYDNELSRFRFDVILRIGDSPRGDAPVPLRWDWSTEGLDCASVTARLQATQPALVVIENIPNRSVCGWFAALAALRDEPLTSRTDLRAIQAERTQQAPWPDALRTLEQKLPYRVELLVGTAPDCYRAVLRRGTLVGQIPAEGEGAPLPFPPRHAGPVFANTPVSRELDEQLVQALRTQLRRALPDYMMPAVFVVLPALPTLPNGKINRAALPDPANTRRGSGAYVAPQGVLQTSLVRIFADVLGIAQVGIHDNFFELGGDSIRGIRVVHQAKSAGFDLSVRELFANPTVAALAALAADRPQDLAPIRLAPFAQLSMADRALVPAGVLDTYPLTRLQAGMAFHTLFGKEDALYHDILAFDLQLPRPFSPAELRSALQRQVDQQAVLRTSFDVRTFSEPMQLVHAAVALPLTITDARDWPAAEQDKLIDTLFGNEKAASFDLSVAPLFRVHIVWRTDKRAVFLFSFHHAILDGWSTATLLSELLRELLTGPSAASVRPYEYGDYVALERQSMAHSASRRYFADRLVGAEPLRIPARPGPTADSSIQATHELTLSPAEGAALERLATLIGVPLRDVLLAAHAKVLAMWTGRSDLLLGVVHNGRLEVEGGEQMLGLFLNTPVLRLQLQPGSFAELCRQVSREERDLLAHRRFPLAEIYAILGSRRAFDIYFNYTHFHVLGDAATELSIAAHGTRSFARTNFPLALVVEKHPQHSQLKLLLKYDAGIYPSAQIAELADAYLAVLRTMGNHPEARHERFHVAAQAAEQHTTRFRQPLLRAVRNTVLDDIAAQAAQRPDAVAIEHPEGSLRYDQLQQCVDSLARELNALGAGPDVLVGVALGGGLRQLLMMLGTFRCGAVYVPLRLEEPLLRWQRLTRKAPPALLVIPETAADSVVERVAHLERRPTVLLCRDERIVGVLAPHGDGYGPPSAPPDPASAAPPRPGVDQANYIFYTSGSTGEPKAILGSHGSIRQFVGWEIDAFGLGPGCRCGQVARVQFDAYLRETLVPLCAGGTLVIPDDRTRGDIEQLLLWMGSRRLTLIHTVPSVMRLLLKAGQHVPTGTLALLKHYVMGGEPLSVQDITAWRKEFGAHTELINIYGTTETTCIKTFYRIGDTAQLLSQRIPAGGPMAEAAMAVIDVKSGRACLPGEVGEIYLKSPYMTLGYYRDPQLTQQVFVQNPLVDFPDIVYRTGDLGRILPDGTLEVLGRIDNQIKRNGIRIELGEIEEALRIQPGIRETLVVAEKQTSGNVVISAYFTSSDAARQDTEALRKGLRRSLPGYMMPNHLLELAAFPLLQNGKIDRAALPPPDGPQDAQNRLLPADEWEALLGEIFREVLGFDAGQPLPYDVPFFELGGNSLLAMQLVSRVHRLFHVSLPLRDVFAHASIEEMARQIARLRPISQTIISAVAAAADYPVSNAQRRLWVLHHLDETSTGYHIREAFVLRGVVDVAALDRATTRLIDRHEILRTALVSVDGEPRQVVHPSASHRSPRLDFRDLRSNPPPQTELASQVLQLVHGRFDLTNGALLRLALWQLAEDQWLLVIAMHHSITDAWSIGILRRELVALYSAQIGLGPASLPPLRIQYKDYAAWQHTWLSSDAAAQARAYFVQRFHGPLPLLDLPTDRPRTAFAMQQGAVRTETLERQTVERLRALGQQSGATLFMTLLTLLKSLLYRYSGQTDLIVGTPSSGRTHVELEHQLGYYVNTLALRTEIDPSLPFGDALQRVQATCVQAYEHRDYPFDRMVEDVAPERDLTRHPLFDVMFTHTIDDQRGVSVLPGVSADPYPLPARSPQLDLSIHVIEQAFGLTVHIDYNPALFLDQRMARLWRHLCLLIDGVLSLPQCPLADLPLIAPEDLAELHKRAQPIDNDLIPAEDLLNCIARQAATRPDSLAITQRDRSLTYRELWTQAERLAAYLLHTYDVGPGHIVALYMERSLDVILIELAVLRCGAAFLPVDVSVPISRFASIVTDSASCVVVHDRGELPNLGSGVPVRHVHDLWAACESTPPAVLASPVGDPPAYVLYTSGSTGTPKGAVIGRQSLSNLCACYGRLAGFSSESRVTHGNSIGFDASMLEVWPTLTKGGQIIVLPGDAFHDLPALLRFAVQRGITHLDMPTVLVEQMVADPLPDLPAWLVVTTGGDVLHRAETRRFRLINQYGLTETTAVNVAIDFLDFDDANGVPIGKPMNGTRVYLLDAAQRPVPLGLPGEIYLAGPSLARGYLNRPDLTAARFVKSPFDPAEVMYRTGDRGRFRLDDGNLEFLGRVDAQIKIRGYRVELGEIEAGLLRHEAVDQAWVITTPDLDGHPKLFAYVVPKRPLVPGELRTFLSSFLPHYMLPSQFMELAQFPLNTSGKRDLSRMPKPTFHDALTALTPVVPPATAMESAMAAIWQRVLDRTAVSVVESFFNLGGYSLKAMSMAALVHRELGVELPLSLVYEKSTVRALAAYVEQAQQMGIKSAVRPYLMLGAPSAAPGRTLFLFPPALGFGAAYGQLAEQIPGYTLYAFNHVADDATLQRYVDLIDHLQPQGAFTLLGHSAGGFLALLVAQALETRGRAVSQVVLLDTFRGGRERQRATQDEIRAGVDAFLLNPRRVELRSYFLTDRHLRERTYRQVQEYFEFLWQSDLYVRIHAPIHLVRAEENHATPDDWSEASSQGRINHYARGPHRDLLEPPYLADNAALLRQLFERKE